MTNNRSDYVELLRQMLCDRVPLNILKQAVSVEERAFFNMLFMTTLRRLAFIKENVLPCFIKKKIPQKQSILEYILYLGCAELLFMDTPDYAVVSSYVDAAKKLDGRYGANFINAVLRNVLRNKDSLLSGQKGKYFSKTFLDILKRDYTTEEISEMQKYAGIEAPLDITPKTEESAVRYLQNGKALPTGSFRFSPQTKVSELTGYNEGAWWVQDVSSALPVKCMGTVRDKKILDLCAAPGGKTAQLLAGGAVVTAVDIAKSRLNVLKENMVRLGLLQNLTVICTDVLDFKPTEQFDIILLDAPCSATGTFRRHPEIIHTRTLKDVAQQAKLQKKMLNHIAGFVKTGGRLIYSTCSLAKDEGENQILQFIKDNPNFQIEPVSPAGAGELLTEDGFIRVLPQYVQTDNFLTSGADGFFIACLKRKI